jgi:hypothetical protein
MQIVIMDEAHNLTQPLTNSRWKGLLDVLRDKLSTAQNAVVVGMTGNACAFVCVCMGRWVRSGMLVSRKKRCFLACVCTHSCTTPCHSH